ncbi:MAG: uracil phosphoribosyltransferase [Gammaproteobacteria bacterium GWE2_42_36]|nr:MAG: uracil phosphoribosyltransferase [Gammaproteobacteria bacterium GWE2_42_36]HCU05748.1 uracil phosphoribosyltransferase [Coxiellaceae bacterium]
MPYALHANHPNLLEITHPVIQYKLTLLREQATGHKTFNELVNEIAHLLAYEATRNLPLTKRQIETPLETFDAPDLEDHDFLIVPILRAGLGMAEGLLEFLPMATVGHIGFYRDEKTLAPKNYYFKMPKNAKTAHCFVCDPMLATGGTACAAISLLKQYGIKSITFLCLVAAPEGVKKVFEVHPDIQIYTVSLDRQLNEHGYILPGLGDAGDRLWGCR